MREESRCYGLDKRIRAAVMSVMNCITRGSADRSGDFQHEKIERILFSRGYWENASLSSWVLILKGKLVVSPRGW
jgi:hypothetical protein